MLCYVKKISGCYAGITVKVVDSELTDFSIMQYTG